MNLATLNGWPEQKPNVPPVDHGWFEDCNRRLLERLVTPEVWVVVELGSWLGKSTRWFLDRPHCPTVIAIDHWEGGPTVDLEHPDIAPFAGRLYETFLVNLWDYRERLYPLRTTTIVGMESVAMARITVDLIYLDADHTEQAVTADLETASRLFPDAVLCGDDWKWDGVRQAVCRHAGSLGKQFQTEENAWVIC